jgi:rhamnose utilization protein RhaD (predicted bifunctional aldolase and dehydrogenase)/NAD(P)-dependent dehydrogenase (short-subunit alcohol dehydrogenase family)
MKSNWSDQEMNGYVQSCGNSIPAELGQLLYATRLLGSEGDLALHGGGNTSLKTNANDCWGEKRPALFVKASGASMAEARADDFVAIDSDKANRLRDKKEITDREMAELFRMSLLRPTDRLPSIETLLHHFLPFTFVDHTHPSSVLALTNRHDAALTLREAFGTQVAVIPYTKVGHECARASLDAISKLPRCIGLVIMHHGLVTWGATAKEAYEATIRLVSLAETYLAGKKIRTLTTSGVAPTETEALSRYAKIAPVIRGQLSPASGDADMPYKKVVLRPLIDKRILELLAAEEAEQIVSTTPLTPDYLIRIRRSPLFIASPELNDTAALREQIAAARERYLGDYQSYVKRCGIKATDAADSNALFPRVMLIPGVGCICAAETMREAEIVSDIMAQALSVKRTIFETGGDYADLGDDHCADMEFRSYQRAKIKQTTAPDRLAGSIVLVTGAAGAIGTGICSALLDAGCHVVASDLAGTALDNLSKELGDRHGADRVLAVGMDVTDPASIEQGFASIVACYGGIDGVVVNAGIAHVALLADLELEAFRKLEKVNIEGTLLTIREAAKVFKAQNIGGDIVLISTKNVFAPGASFGAYSATKAAAHQIARIASLELAEIGVRVNMVAPDAVFSHGSRKSGLWATVGPDRMRSRGLDEAGLEEYYRKRNLLKAKVTAEHVAAAVTFFLSRQTPTTGATLPVDGGLPDSTPR